MKSMTSPLFGRFLLCVLAVTFSLTMVLTPDVQARSFLSNGGSGGGPGQATEGDPLDANDFDSGGGPIDDDIHDTASAGSVPVPGPRSIPLIKASFFGGSYLIGLEFMGNVPVWHFMKISGVVATAEGTDAR